MKKLILLSILSLLIAPCISFAQAKTEVLSKSFQYENFDDNNIDTGKTIEPIYRIAQEYPQFKGDLNKFLSDNVNYPYEAKINNIQGRVNVEFVILPSGKVDTNSIKILRGLGYGTDEEVIRVMKIMPDWKPGMRNGEAVNLYYMITVNFFL